MTVSSTKLDLLAITETSEKEDTGFLNNVEIEGYEKYHTPSKTSKGGTAIYVNKDKILMALLKDSTLRSWIEIKNKKSKNIICGSIFRHPHDNIQNFNNFLDYMENTLNKISNENKEIYICGDFDSDLLKMDRNTNYKKFYEQMYSYGSLPQITQPTRVTDRGISSFKDSNSDSFSQ